MPWFIFKFGLATRSALACSVCFSASGRSLEAYYWTTAVLMLLPSALAALAFLWIRHRSKRRPD